MSRIALPRGEHGPFESSHHSGQAGPKRTGSRPHRQPTIHMEGQRLLVEAMRYLIQTDREGNREAAELISEHVVPSST